MIYMITAIRLYSELDLIETVSIGWYTDFNKAHEIVIANKCDINESGHYPWVVIEKISEGLYRYVNSEVCHWYTWNKSKEIYEVTLIPRELTKHKIVCYGMG